MKLLILALALALLIGFASGAEQKFSINQTNTTIIFITPEMFGAVGDNSADDSTALQAMIDYAEANGATILLPFKSYAFGTELDIPSGTTIRGVRGRYSWQDGYYGSRLRYTGSGNALNLTAASGMRYKITLEDFALQGAGTSIMNGVGTGIYAKGVSEFWFRDMDIRGFETGIYGYDLTIGEVASSDFTWNDQAIYLPYASRIAIRDCNIWNNGIGIRQSMTTNVVIENNQFERCTDFLKFDSSKGSGTVVYRPVISWNNFHSRPDDYTAGDGLAPYWDCHVINVTNQDYASNTLIINYLTMMGNFVDVHKTNGHINVNLATGDSYAYMHFYENSFYGMNTSIVDETGSGTAVTAWMWNSIPGGKQYASGNVQVAGYSFDWDRTNVLGKLVLNTTLSTTEGAIWYDTGANKLKFYNGAAVETVTSST